MMQLALLTAQMFTLQSSPPVASRRPELLARAKQETVRECASNSSEQQQHGRDKLQLRAHHKHTCALWE